MHACLTSLPLVSLKDSDADDTTPLYDKSMGELRLGRVSTTRLITVSWIEITLDTIMYLVPTNKVMIAVGPETPAPPRELGRHAFLGTRVDVG